MSAESTGQDQEGATDESTQRDQSRATGESTRRAREHATDDSAATTTVTVRCTGHVREGVGTHELEFTFDGTRLRDFLEAFFEEYDVEDLLIAETEADATARGWAEPPAELPGTWRKNPEGE